VITEGSGRHLGARWLAVGRYKESWLPDHPLAWDTALDAAARLNDGISEDANWTVFEAWGMDGTGQVTGFGTAVIVGIYHQRGYLLTQGRPLASGPRQPHRHSYAYTSSRWPAVDRCVDHAW
jgi:hypothetical protein